jgi:hypothetical protein
VDEFSKKNKYKEGIIYLLLRGEHNGPSPTLIVLTLSVEFEVVARW